MSDVKTIPIYRTEKHSLLTLLGCLSLTAFLFGFSSSPKISRPVLQNKHIPVGWTQELSMASLLAKVPAVNSQKDLSALLANPWYANFDVTTDKAGESKTLHNCHDYFALKVPGLRAQQEPENNSLLELKVMCEATRLLSQATSAQYSKIPKNPLNSQLPKKLPKLLAFEISKVEWDRAQKDPRITHLADVEPIKRVERRSAHQNVYHLAGGAQTLAILGRGDMNGDKWEDILVAVKDTVDGGSYFNLRLFVLTVTPQGQWQVVAHY